MLLNLKGFWFVCLFPGDSSTSVNVSGRILTSSSFNLHVDDLPGQFKSCKTGCVHVCDDSVIFSACNMSFPLKKVKVLFLISL